MRAFRPSHFAQDEDYDEDADRAKQDNLRVYAQRAQEGLPLFGSIVPQLSHPVVKRVVAGG
jgi:hypothetical protein